MPGPYLGYWNSSMRLVTCFDLSRRGPGQRGPDRLPHGVPQRHALDSLCSPVGGDLGGGDSPQLLVVGLEEVVVEAPSVVRDDVPLQCRQVLRGMDPDPQEGEAAQECLDHPQVGQGVPQLDRVVVELPAVVDAAHAGTEQEVLGRKHLVPELLDGLHLGEEPVTPDIEAPALTLHGTADPAHYRVRLDHRDRVTPLHQLVGGGEAGWAGSDHQHRFGEMKGTTPGGRYCRLVGSGHGLGCLMVSRHLPAVLSLRPVILMETDRPRPSASIRRPTVGGTAGPVVLGTVLPVRCRPAG